MKRRVGESPDLHLILLLLSLLIHNVPGPTATKSETDSSPVQPNLSSTSSPKSTSHPPKQKQKNKKKKSSLAKPPK